MKVKDLIEILKRCDPEQSVIMSRDAEGNRYSPLSEAVDGMKYWPENTWSGTCYDSNDADEFSPEDWNSLENVVVLWPVN